ncbi:MAG TPA: GAF domain-containing protein [Polyangia bacterium]|nr:GAF domain-containing protein [Polyangia bacterium]
MSPPAEPHPAFVVHERGDRSLDGIFRLIEMASREDRLDQVLAGVCADVAAIAGADVVSIYVREHDDEGDLFTMRGNVGFPADAVGRVSLRAGEGIVGFVAERLRPVSVAVAEQEQHFKYIPGLGEERFPALLAVPVLHGGGAVGVLVLQRGEAAPFASEEVVLATALAAVTSHALERAHARERERKSDRGVARLRGVSLSPGTAMGPVEILPTLAALARTAEAPGAERVPLDAVVQRLQADLRKMATKTTGAAAREIASFSLMLDDDRFRKRLSTASEASAPLPALSQLAREYARVAFRTASGDQESSELLAERAAEIEDLCVLVYAATSGRPLIRSGAIVVSEKLRGFSVLYAIARGASGFVVDGEVAKGSGAAAIVQAAGLPLLAAVTGVFSWVRPVDLLLVDADADEGTIRVNPEAAAVARFRTTRG